MKDSFELFSVERKGYNRVEVEQYIKKIEKDKNTLELEIESLKKQLEAVCMQKEQLENKQALIEDTLINAELAARDIVLKAEEKSAEAEKLYQVECEKVEKKYAEYKEELDQIVKRVEYILRSQLALIEKNNLD